MVQVVSIRASRPERASQFLLSTVVRDSNMESSFALLGMSKMRKNNIDLWMRYSSQNWDPSEHWFCEESGRDSSQNPWFQGGALKFWDRTYFFERPGGFSEVLWRIGSGIVTKWNVHQGVFFVKNTGFTKWIVRNHCFQISIHSPRSPDARSMPKRKSSDGQAAKAKAKAPKKGDPSLKVPPDALRLPHMKLFDEWM